MGAKAFPISFDKIDAFIKIYDGIRFLVLFATERYNVIFNRILQVKKVLLHILLVITL